MINSTHRQSIMENDDESCNITPRQSNEFLDEQGKIGKISRPYVSHKVKTKDELLPLRVKMMRDYAKSKAVNDDQVYLKIKTRQQQFANSRVTHLQSSHHPMEFSRKSSKDHSIVIKPKSITLSKSKKAQKKQEQEKKLCLQEIVVQNNEYFHRMNQSVMNRLLGIIENNHSKSINANGNNNEYDGGKANSTHPHSLAESRHIVINNILPKKNQNQTNSLINSKMKFTQQKVQKLYSQRKTFSYATPKAIKEHIDMQNHTEGLHKEQEKLGNNNYRSLHEDKKLQAQFIFSTCQKQINQDNEKDKERLNNNFKRRERQFKKQRKAKKENDKQQINDSMMVENRQFVAIMNDPVDFSQATYRTEQILVENQQCQTNRSQKMPNKQYHKGIMNRFEGSQSSGISQIACKEEDQSKEENQSKEEERSNQVSQNNENLKKAPVFIQIPFNDEKTQTLSLAEAFKRKIGKLPSQSMPKKQRRPASVSPIPRKTYKKSKEAGKENKMSQESNNASHNKANLHLGDLNCSMIKSLQGGNSAFITPKSSEPSEDLVNRLIGGSKAKVSKKEMYALTKKNYENLPQVKEKKRLQKKKQLEKQRLQRIKEYQKSIRASKTTITSIH